MTKRNTTINEADAIPPNGFSVQCLGCVSNNIEMHYMVHLNNDEKQFDIPGRYFERPSRK